MHASALTCDPGRAQGSLLSEWFSGNVPLDDDGYVFIDRHPEVCQTRTPFFDPSVLDQGLYL